MYHSLLHFSCAVASIWDVWEGLGFVVFVSVFKPVVKGKHSGPITNVSPTSLTDCAPCNPQIPGDWLFSLAYIIK